MGHSVELCLNYSDPGEHVEMWVKTECECVCHGPTLEGKDNVLELVSPSTRDLTV